MAPHFTPDWFVPDGRVGGTPDYRVGICVPALNYTYGLDVEVRCGLYNGGGGELLPCVPTPDPHLFRGAVSWVSGPPIFRNRGEMTSNSPLPLKANEEPQGVDLTNLCPNGCVEDSETDQF